MQQNYSQLSSSPIIWDADSDYQISNVYGATGFIYQYVPLVTNAGDLYYLNGVALNDGTPPASDPAYVAITGGASSMLPLPQQFIYVGQANGQPLGVAMSGDVTIAPTGATFITDATVTSKTLTGFVSNIGTVTASDTILTATEKIDGNNQATQTALASSSTFTAGDTSPYMNYIINNIAGIITFKIYDNTNFVTIGGGSAGPVSFTYNLPIIPGITLSSIIGIASLLNTGASVTGLSIKSSAFSTSAVTMYVVNTGPAAISDGLLFTTIDAKLA